MELFKVLLLNMIVQIVVVDYENNILYTSLHSAYIVYKGGDIVAKGQIKQKQATINQDTFESLCSIQCTELEICEILKISPDTLVRWCKNTYGENFAETYKKKSAEGKASLRRAMFKNAMNGNATMQIWLSRQHLGMKDNIEVESKQLVKVEELLNKIEEEANK